MKYLKSYKIFEKQGVPDEIVPYVNDVYNKMSFYINKYFESGVKKDFGKQLDIESPKFLSKNKVELLIYRYDRSDKTPFKVGGVFSHPKRGSSISPTILTISIHINNKYFNDSKIDDLKLRVKQVIQHEALHGYEFSKSGGPSMFSTLSHIVGRIEDYVKSLKDENYELYNSIYRKFLIPLHYSVPHEMRAKVSEIIDIKSMSELKKTKTWIDVEYMIEFDPKKCYDEIKSHFNGDFSEFDKNFGDSVGLFGKSLMDILVKYSGSINKAGDTVRRKLLKRIEEI